MAVAGNPPIGDQLGDQNDRYQIYERDQHRPGEILPAKIIDPDRPGVNPAAPGDDLEFLIALLIVEAESTQFIFRKILIGEDAKQFATIQAFEDFGAITADPAVPVEEKIMALAEINRHVDLILK